jgi:hypothetical protein
MPSTAKSPMVKTVRIMAFSREYGAFTTVEAYAQAPKSVSTKGLTYQPGP